MAVYQQINLDNFDYDEEEKHDIAEIMTGTEEEHKFALLAYRLLQGIDFEGRWLRIEKNNTPHSKDDKAIYRVDYSILEDKEQIGYIDLEKKPSWKIGEWPYPRTNIAIHPMNDWINHNIRENVYTVKLRSFSQKPDMSFWIGVRSDWGALWIVPFHSIINHGIKTEQTIKNYRNVPDLPVLAVPNKCCTYCDDPEDFTEYILANYLEQKNAE